MELPDEIIKYIKEYSMPMTYPNWKTLHKMPLHDFKLHLCEICYPTYLIITEEESIIIWYFGKIKMMITHIDLIY